METPTQQGPKKAYTAPHLVVHGSVEQLTHGQGWGGSDDMFVFHAVVWGKEISGSFSYGSGSRSS